MSTMPRIAQAWAVVRLEFIMRQMTGPPGSRVCHLDLERKTIVPLTQGITVSCTPWSLLSRWNDMHTIHFFSVSMFLLGFHLFSKMFFIRWIPILQSFLSNLSRLFFSFPSNTLEKLRDGSAKKIYDLSLCRYLIDLNSWIDGFLWLHFRLHSSSCTSALALCSLRRFLPRPYLQLLLACHLTFIAILLSCYVYGATMIAPNDFGAVVMVCRVGTVEKLFVFLFLAKQRI